MRVDSLRAWSNAASMFDELKIPLRLSAAVGATFALFSTFLPWYAFGVVIPGAEVPHIFAVTTTLWGWTTLAPILIVAGSVLALIFTALVPGRTAGAVIALVGLGVTAYAVVRCVDIPGLSVRGTRGAHTLTELEGGPFVAIAGGVMLLVGGIGEMIVAPRESARPWYSRSPWRGPSTPPPHAVS
jgi:hypothetical protein